ncbi:TonB-dependent receptor [Bacillus amyloliquefaciens]|uniref:TonB-dependent receptor n=1 Tax=Bacillus amyloliquefaciens TaxID=1390 RepID=UPI00255B764C|nr:TonB-dependent receptor [Bacillus amyloliquefaciens]WIX29276.1 TonB-dependent receptor [Bacillus amyloliquefaciens]
MTDDRLLSASTYTTANKGFSASFNWRYVGSLTNANNSGDAAIGGTAERALTNYYRVAPQSYFDLALNFAIAKQFSLRLIANNLLDVEGHTHTGLAQGVDDLLAQGNVVQGNGFGQLHNQLVQAQGALLHLRCQRRRQPHVEHGAREIDGDLQRLEQGHRERAAPAATPASACDWRSEASALAMSLLWASASSTNRSSSGLPNAVHQSARAGAVEQASAVPRAGALVAGVAAGGSGVCRPDGGCSPLRSPAPDRACPERAQCVTRSRRSSNVLRSSGIGVSPKTPRRAWPSGSAGRGKRTK